MCEDVLVEGVRKAKVNMVNTLQTEKHSVEETCQESNGNVFVFLRHVTVHVCHSVLFVWEQPVVGHALHVLLYDGFELEFHLLLFRGLTCDVVFQ